MTALRPTTTPYLFIFCTLFLGFVSDAGAAEEESRAREKREAVATVKMMELALANESAPFDDDRAASFAPVLLVVSQKKEFAGIKMLEFLMFKWAKEGGIANLSDRSNGLTVKQVERAQYCIKLFLFSEDVINSPKYFYDAAYEGEKKDPDALARFVSILYHATRRYADEVREKISQDDAYAAVKEARKIPDPGLRGAIIKLIGLFAPSVIVIASNFIDAQGGTEIERFAAIGSLLQEVKEVRSSSFTLQDQEREVVDALMDRIQEYGGRTDSGGIFRLSITIELLQRVVARGVSDPQRSAFFDEERVCILCDLPVQDARDWVCIFGIITSCIRAKARLGEMLSDETCALLARVFTKHLASGLALSSAITIMNSLSASDFARVVRYWQSGDFEELFWGMKDLKKGYSLREFWQKHAGAFLEEAHHEVGHCLPGILNRNGMDLGSIKQISQVLNTLNYHHFTATALQPLWRAGWINEQLAERMVVSGVGSDEQVLDFLTHLYHWCCSYADDTEAKKCVTITNQCLKDFCDNGFFASHVGDEKKEQKALLCRFVDLALSKRNGGGGLAKWWRALLVRALNALATMREGVGGKRCVRFTPPSFVAVSRCVYTPGALPSDEHTYLPEGIASGPVDYFDEMVDDDTYALLEAASMQDGEKAAAARDILAKVWQGSRFRMLLQKRAEHGGRSWEFKKLEEMCLDEDKWLMVLEEAREGNMADTLLFELYYGLLRKKVTGLSFMTIALLRAAIARLGNLATMTANMPFLVNTLIANGPVSVLAQCTTADLDAMGAFLWRDIAYGEFRATPFAQQKNIYNAILKWGERVKGGAERWSESLKITLDAQRDRLGTPIHRRACKLLRPRRR